MGAVCVWGYAEASMTLGARLTALPTTGRCVGCQDRRVHRSMHA